MQNCNKEIGFEDAKHILSYIEIQNSMTEESDLFVEKLINSTLNSQK